MTRAVWNLRPRRCQKGLDFVIAALSSRQVNRDRKLGGSLTRTSRAQAMVELAMVLPVALVILVVAVQMAVIGQVDVALGQADYQGARFASIHPDCGTNSCTGGETAPNDSIKDYVQSVMSPTIVSSNLTIASTPGAPRTQGTSVSVTLTYNTSGQLFLPQNFMGLISFPTTLTTVQTAMSQ